MNAILGFNDTDDSRTRRLKIASAVVAVLFILFLLGRGVPNAIDAYKDPAIKSGAADFRFLYNAGYLITSGEAKRLYGPEPDRNTWIAEHGYQYPVWYPYPPTVALATGALRPLGFNGAANVWQVLVALSTLVIGVLVAREFRSWPWRVAIVLGAVTWEPLLVNARIGQTGAFVAVATLGAVLVFLRNKNVGAILLGLITLKPTAAIGPAMLVFPESLRVWARFAATAAIVILVPFFYLGFSQFKGWVNVLSTRGADDVGSSGAVHYYNQGITSAFGGAGYLGLIVAIVLLVVAAYAVSGVMKRLGMYAGAAFVLVAAALVNPHNLIYDWGTAFIVVLLLRRSELIAQKYADFALGGLIVTLWFAGEVAWDVRYSFYVMRPLTLWAICVTLGLLTVAFWDQIVAFTRPSAKDEAVLALRDAPAPEPPSNKARRRRERRKAAQR